MKIIIIEDEERSASDLVDTIYQIEPDAQILAVLQSVKAAVEYFSKSADVSDLIFCDIQLGDGLSFEIFSKIDIKSPVIFCTAFDEYALQAFRTNSIDYILKPFSKKSISEALSKYKFLQTSFLKSNFNYDGILNLFRDANNPKQGSVLVYYKDKIFPVKFDDIALFYIETEITYLVTFDNNKHTINKTLEELEKLTPGCFHRVNRQHLLNSKAIKEVSQYFARKLSITLKIPYSQKIIISKEKSAEFLNWLSNN